MPISTTKPSPIAILSVEDDMKRGLTKVRYAFRFNITETTEIVEGEEVQAWQYDEIIEEMEISIYAKNSIPQILKEAYMNSSDTYQAIIALHKTQLPTEIDVGE